MAPRLGIKLWLGVHRWTSLICTLFLLMACVTGLPLIFSDELEEAAPAIAEHSASLSRPVLSVDVLRAQVVQGSQARFAQFVFWDDEHDAAVGFGLANTPDAELDRVQRVLVDKRSGRPRVERERSGGLLDTLRKLHTELWLGAVGELVLCGTAVLFVLSVASGIVVYGPFMRRLDFGAIRRTSAKLLWLDLHNLVGIATAAWALVVGATGVMNTLEASLFGAWQAERLPALLSAHAHDAAPVRHAFSLDAAVAAAREALPGMRVTSLGLAGTRYGTPRHHLLWLHGNTTLTKRLFATALIDADSGKVLWAEALPWYLRALEVSRPLHFGDYGGLPMKLLWAVFDLLTIGVLSSGLYLWFAKGRARMGSGAAKSATWISEGAS
jgi:uncharacterized iron-regulated membrane protein